MNKGITIRELAKFCKKAIEEGHGNKTIMISSDDEGNEFHTLYYGFTTDSEEVGNILDMCCSRVNDSNEIVLLG